jgi:hypothetical protein
MNINAREFTPSWLAKAESAEPSNEYKEYYDDYQDHAECKWCPSLCSWHVCKICVWIAHIINSALTTVDDAYWPLNYTIGFLLSFKDICKDKPVDLSIPEYLDAACGNLKRARLMRIEELSVKQDLIYSPLPPLTGSSIKRYSLSQMLELKNSVFIINTSSSDVGTAYQETAPKTPVKIPKGLSAHFSISIANMKGLTLPDDVKLNIPAEILLDSPESLGLLHLLPLSLPLCPPTRTSASLWIYLNSHLCFSLTHTPIHDAANNSPEIGETNESASKSKSKSKKKKKKGSSSLDIIPSLRPPSTASPRVFAPSKWDPSGHESSR